MTARKKSDAKNSVVKKESEKSQYKSANLKDVSDFIVKTISKRKNDKKSVPKKSSSKKPDVPPPVIPLTQIEIDEDGKSILKKVKPLTYSMMSWVKRTLNLPDSIDISDDENYAEYSIDVPSLDGDFDYKCYFNTDEINGLILFYIYYFDEVIPKGKQSKINKLILDKNLECNTGQFQLVNSDKDNKILRYFAGISVKGLASEDPNYSGDFQISPKLFDNLYKDGFDAMNKHIDDFIELIRD